LLAATDLNTLVVLRNLGNDYDNFESKVCSFNEQGALKCFTEENIEFIEQFDRAQWESILFLDWNVLEFLKTADN
jgi:hypothetical protein